MIQVTIHEAKTHLSRLIKRALAGERIIIAKDKTPLVELKVLPEAKTERRLGGLKGAVLHMSDDFDDPIDDFAAYMS